MRSTVLGISFSASLAVACAATPSASSGGAPPDALGGPPLDGKRFMHWNFVSSTRERIERAKEAWRAQEFPRIPGDDREYVPLP